MIGNRIRELRKNLNMSQEALAEKIGTTQQAVSRMETNAYDRYQNILMSLLTIYLEFLILSVIIMDSIA